MEKKNLIKQQFIIILYLLFGAIATIEASFQFQNGGFKNPKFYFFAAIFIFCAVMYFVRKKQRLESRTKK